MVKNNKVLGKNINNNSLSTVRLIPDTVPKKRACQRQITVNGVDVLVMLDSKLADLNPDPLHIWRANVAKKVINYKEDKKKKDIKRLTTLIYNKLISYSWNVPSPSNIPVVKKERQAGDLNKRAFINQTLKILKKMDEREAAVTSTKENVSDKNCANVLYFKSTNNCSHTFPPSTSLNNFDFHSAKLSVIDHSIVHLSPVTSSKPKVSENFLSTTPAPVHLNPPSSLNYKMKFPFLRECFIPLKRLSLPSDQNKNICWKLPNPDQKKDDNIPSDCSNNEVNNLTNRAFKQLPMTSCESQTTGNSSKNYPLLRECSVLLTRLPLPLSPNKTDILPEKDLKKPKVEPKCEVFASEPSHVSFVESFNFPALLSIKNEPNSDLKGVDNANVAPVEENKFAPLPVLQVIEPMVGDSNCVKGNQSHDKILPAKNYIEAPAELKEKLIVSSNNNCSPLASTCASGPLKVSLPTDRPGCYACSENLAQAMSLEITPFQVNVTAEGNIQKTICLDPNVISEANSEGTAMKPCLSNFKKLPDSCDVLNSKKKVTFKATPKSKTKTNIPDCSDIAEFSEDQAIMSAKSTVTVTAERGLVKTVFLLPNQQNEYNENELHYIPPKSDDGNIFHIDDRDIKELSFNNNNEAPFTSQPSVFPDSVCRTITCKKRKLEDSLFQEEMSTLTTKQTDTEALPECTTIIRSKVTSLRPSLVASTVPDQEKEINKNDKWGPPRPGYDFVSTDPAENADNFNAGWAELRDIVNDVERYRLIRNRWRNIGVPDLAKNLTFRHRRPSHQEKSRRKVKPVRRRQRSLSCTSIYEQKIQSARNQKEQVFTKLLAKQAAERNQLLERQNHFISTMSRSYWTEFQIRQTNFAMTQELYEMQAMHETQRHRINVELDAEVRKYQEYMYEVRSFYYFYQGLDLRDNSDKTILTPRQVDLADETERLFLTFRRFYNSK